MAISSSITCLECKRNKTVIYAAWQTKPLVCHDCKGAKEAKERQARLDALKQLPIEERIERIEAWIEDFRVPDPDPRSRLY